MEEKIIVSVVIITYNQENFIKQTIDSILEQKCNFSIEIIIANDNSADSTDEIINEYINNSYLNKSIKYFKHKENIGAMKNFLFALRKAKGKYIAICEGDDYWIDTKKLQKQVDFLEKNSDFSIVFHKAQLEEGNKILNKTIPILEKVKDISLLEDLSVDNYIPTVTVLFKNIYDFPNYIENSFIGDYPLHLYNAERGKIKFIPEVMAIYRIGSGIWSTEAEVNKTKKMIYSLNLIRNNYADNIVVRKNIEKQLNFYYYNYLRLQKKDSILNLLFKDKYLKKLSMKTKFYLFIKILIKN